MYKKIVNRKTIGLLIIAIACALFALRAFSDEPINIGDYYETPLQTIEYIATISHVPIGDEQPVSRAMAAKMLTLALHSPHEIYAIRKSHPFEDVSPNSWYAPYVNAAYVLGIMRGGGERFMPNTPLTIGQAQILIRAMDPDGAPTITNVLTDSRPISYALWVELYKQLLDSLSENRTIYEAFGIIAKDIIVLATAQNSPLPEFRLISDQGRLSHSGLTLDAYIDQQIRVLVRDTEIVALSSIITNRPILKNAYVVDADQYGITVFAGGAERFFRHSGHDTARAPEGSAESIAESSAGGISGGISEGIADVVIYNGTALLVMPIHEYTSGILLRASYNILELKDQGAFRLDENFRVYDTSTGAVRSRGLTHLIVGTDAARFYIDEGIVRAAVITHEAFPENIRVVIGTSNFEGLIHSSVTVTSSGSFWITTGSADAEQIASFAPGQRFTVSDIENTHLFGHMRLFFHAQPGETLQLTGLGRNWPQGLNPRFRGVIEIAREAGGYSVVNALGLEEYLYAVIPSEMPSSYGVQASKVQAVTARSFAVHQILTNRFHAWGGNIDDSVMSQVYNNVPENDISIEAARATRGLVLWYGDHIVQSNFFSTSAGVTANSGEVWASGGTFPGSTPTFLQSRPQFSGHVGEFNLSSESAAREFFHRLDMDAYDNHSPWFRWQLEMTPAEIAASVNATLGEPIGNLQNMSVLRRGQGGNIMTLRLAGDEGIVVIETELQIRTILRPARVLDGERDIAIRRHDGSTLLNLAMLPSAFFTFDKIYNEEGRLERIAFYGGGHGHGVGMSQNGVRGMIDRGYTFDEVLGHFYPGTVIEDFMMQ